MKNHEMNAPKLLTKNDFRWLYFLIFMQYFAAVYDSKDQSAVLVIVGMASIFPLCLLLTKIVKKRLSVVVIYRYFGILGVYSAFVSALLLSYRLGDSFKKSALIFGISCAVIVMMILLLDLIFGKSMEKVKNTTAKTATVTVFASVGAVAGMYTSQYLRTRGMDLQFELAIGVLGFGFIFFHTFTMKSRSLLKNGSR